MFIGHFGAGFAAKKIDNLPSLGTLFAAAQFIDLLWPVLLILNLEHVRIDPGNTAFTPLNFINYPISHGFFAVAIWAVLFGGVYFLIKKNTKGALLLSVLVMSHWILDFVTHRPDLPLFPWSDIKVGLGLWNNVALTILLEGLIFIGGVYLYMSATKAKNKSGNYGLWGLIVFLIIVYTANIFGPPPNAAEPIAYVGLSQWLLVFWAYWIDRNRASI